MVEEAERSLNDMLNTVRNIYLEPKIVGAGGAPEIEIAKKLREYAETLSGREQLAVNQFAEAMEVVPRTLAENAGLDPIDILVELRAKHEKDGVTYGIDVFSGKVADMAELDVWEPALVKKQAIKSATEAAALILRIDDVIAASAMKSETPGGEKSSSEEEESSSSSEFD